MGFNSGFKGLSKYMEKIEENEMCGGE